MLKSATKLVVWVTPGGVLTLAAVAASTVGAVPAQAQDPFGFFKPYTPPVAAPLYQPSSDSQPLTLWVRPRRKAKAAQVQKPPLKVAPVTILLKPKDPGEIANPVPALLADGTLRSGDLVMFPGGLRVFAGDTGTKHKLSDFEPLAQAGKAVPAATRKLVAQLRPGWNGAWSADVTEAGGKLALNSKGGEAAKVRRKGR
jgi:hypothetical protein